MSIPFIDRFKPGTAQKIPLRLWFTVPCVLQIILVAGLISWLSWRNGQMAVNRLAEQVQEEVGERVEQKIATYIGAPKLITRINADNVRSGRLNLQNLADVEQYLFTQIQQFESVSGILIGTVDGNLRAVNRRDGYRLLKSDRTDNGTIYNYALNQKGEKIKSLSVIPKRPNVLQMKWYRTAMAAKSPVWSPVFQTADNPALSLNANYPIYSDRGELLGVASSGIVLSVIDQFLKRLDINPAAVVFIVQRDGNLVATSTDRSAYTTQKEGNKVTLTQIKAEKSEHDLIRHSAENLYDNFGNLLQVRGKQKFSFIANNQRNFVRVVPCQDGIGLDWLIVVVIPESGFMSQINANTQLTILLSLAAVLLTIGINIFVASRMAQPMRQLSQASQAVAAGDLSQQVAEGSPIAEMQVTAHAFNHMAQQLQNSFTQIEQANLTLEAQVTERTAQLQQAVEELETLNILKDDFLSTVSHELRSPMSNIKVATEMLEISLNQLDILNGSSEKITRYFQILKDECRRETELINDLLDLARLEANTDPLILKTLDLHIWIPAILEPFTDRIRNQQQTLTLHLSPDLPSLTTDVSDFERILTELMHNACKYTPSHETLTLTATAIPRLSSSPLLSPCPPAPPSHLRLTLTNSGIEIPPEERDRIFEKFYRIRSNDPWKHGGTGLGLALVKRLVERLQGQIMVTSATNVTTFTLEFPVTLDTHSSKSITC